MVSLLSILVAANVSLASMATTPSRNGSLSYWSEALDSEAEHAMVIALQRYRIGEQRGGWPSFVELMGGETLAFGDRDPRITALRERLLLTSDLRKKDPQAMGSDLFDLAIAKALHRFQARHGLTAHGLLDQETLEELSIPVEERIRVILINLERLRWLPRQEGTGRYIWVNVPSFEVGLYERGRRMATIRAVVGKPRRQTPIFSHRIRYLEVNPPWVVPRRIVRGRILPRAVSDPQWLTRAGFELLDRTGRVDPANVDWEAVVETRKFPYAVRQRPGPRNAMGRVKFMFPNQHQVYLHDTPDQEYFAERQRTFSSGCVRVEEPKVLARFLLQDLPEEEVDTIVEMIAGEGQRDTLRVSLPSPVPVHIVYLTAWVDRWGALQFRPDVYGHDVAAAQRLDERSPGWDEP